MPPKLSKQHRLAQYIRQLQCHKISFSLKKYQKTLTEFQPAFLQIVFNHGLSISSMMKIC